METIRSFRIVFPPFTFLGMILLAMFLNDSLILELRRLENKGVLTAVAGAVAASLIPLGFLIGGLTNIAMRVCSQFRKDKFRQHFQMVVDFETARKVWKKLGLEELTENECNAIYGVQAFNHGLDEWLENYIDRQWDASNGYAGAAIALLLAGLVVCWWKISSVSWWLVAVILFVVFISLVILNWREMGKLIKFHVNHPKASLDSAKKVLGEGLNQSVRGITWAPSPDSPPTRSIGGVDLPTPVRLQGETTNLRR